MFILVKKKINKKKKKNKTKQMRACIYQSVYVLTPYKEVFHTTDSFSRW